MPFVALCLDTDKRDAQAIRAAELQAHLDYVADVKEQLLVAGPLRLDGAEHYNASLFIYDVGAAADARELLEGDPYFQAGLYETVTLGPFTPARGRWLTTMQSQNKPGRTAR